MFVSTRVVFWLNSEDLVKEKLFEILVLSVDGFGKRSDDVLVNSWSNEVFTLS